MSTYLAWVEEKCLLARTLENGCCGGSYSEGAIILCTCIGAMASRLWVESERSRQDQKRFVEIVTTFSKPKFDPKKISVPLLAQDNDEWKQRLNLTDKAFRRTGANDKTENEILALCAATPQSISKKAIRQYSYANILYKDIRCGFAHTYLPTAYARSDDPLRQIFDASTPQISYVNRMHENMRQIHFPLEWIAEVVKSVACGMDVQCVQNSMHIGENIGLSVPDAWWIDGA